MSSVETVSALERRLNASIPQQAIQGGVAARLKKIGRSAKIAGFRPGKVPAKILEQHYGAQAHQEALGDALQRSFAEAVESNNINVAGHPKFDIKTNDLHADLIEYSATFEVYPEVALGDLSGETVERSTYEVTQTDVDNTIANLRKQRATFEAVSRAAQNDDRTMIDFVGKLNGEVFQGGEGKNYPVTLGSGNMLPEFEAAIVGLKAGDTRSFDLTFPENYYGKELAGKQVTFTITLHSIEAPRLPELDAEFAKAVGIADGDLSKLESEIRSNLSREVSHRLKVRNKGVALDALLKVAKFEAPKALLEWEAQSLMKQTMQDMESRGMKMKGISLLPGLFMERAEKRVKLGLILADLVQKHDLKAKHGQTKALIMDYAQSYDEPEQVMRWYAADPKRMQEIENLILEENVAAWVMGKAKVVDKPAAYNDLMGNG